MLFYCLQRNAEASCHKHFVVVSRYQQHRQLVPSTWYGPSQLSVLHLAVESLTARDGARYWLRIAISAYSTCIRRPRWGGFRRNIAVTFDTEKTRMVWLIDGENFLKIRYDRIHERNRRMDRRADRQTPRDGIGRACVASRGKIVTR